MCSDPNMCHDFWENLRIGLKNTNFKILSSYINVKEYNKEFPKTISHDSYELLFSTIINNYIHFLFKNNSRGSIIFEAREETQNRKIQQYYFHILKHGTNIYQSNAIDNYITTTSFLVKEENCIGLQIADLTVYNCIRYINRDTIKHNIWNIIEPKIYGYKDDIETYGIVKLF